MAELPRLVTLPDGTTVLIDPATGQPVTNQFGEPFAAPVGTIPPKTTAPAGPSPNPAPIQPPGVSNAANPVPIVPVGPGGLPLDPLGNGAPLSVAPAPAIAADGGTSYDDGGSYSQRLYDDYRRRYSGYEPEPPRYGDNRTHPYFGGEPLAPGGVFAQSGGTDDYRQQVTATSGATAGPFAVRAAPAPRANYGGGGSSGGGGGGGIARDLYWHFANKIKGAITGESSYGAYPEERSYRPYRGPEDPRTVRQIERMDPRMRGRYASGVTADVARGYYQNPEWMLGSQRVLPDINRDSLLYDRLSSMPMAQLALLTGSGQRGWQGGLNPMEDVYDDYYKKLNRRLEHGRQGIDFAPFYRKQLRRDDSLSDFTNTLGGLYNNLGSGQIFDTEALFGNLAKPAKKTYFAEAFKPNRSGNNVAGMGDAYLSAYNAILSAGPYGDLQRTILSDRASDFVADYYAQYGGKKNPRNAPRLNQWVSRQMAAYG